MTARVIVMSDREGHVRSGFPADLEDERVQRLAGRRGAVDCHDPIAGPQAGGLGGRSLERRDDDDGAGRRDDGARREIPRVVQVLHSDLGADPAELARQVVECPPVDLGPQVAAVGIL
jgi:hypothetical protein